VQTLEGLIRAFVGLVFLGVMVILGIACLIPLLPWHTLRIKFTNHFGTVVGSGIMWVSGCEVRVHGREHVHSSKPAIYAGNHTSIFDAFTSIWLSPVGTVGVAKKEIIYYPFYGLAWLLAGHLTIDRGHTERAKASMAKMGAFVKQHGLHIFMWPEGTRAADGRLLPFKKGVAHLALQTRLPIVPMVTVGAHKAWMKGSLLLRKVPIDITFLPPIDTTGWSEDHLDAHVEALRQAFIAALPMEQRPVEVSLEPA
jgi:lysophosphatidate acyltransferase